MRKKITAALLTTGLVMMLVLPGVAIARGDDGGKRGHGFGIRGKIGVEGFVTAVHLGASTFVMQVTTRRSLVGSDGFLVLIQSVTELRGKDEDDDHDHEHPRAASIHHVRVGDRVRVEGFLLSDGRLLALKLEIRNRVVVRPLLRPVLIIAARGVVVVVTVGSTRSLVVLGSDGLSRLVVVTPATEVRGLRTSLAAVRLHDIVVVQGTVNADGTISARQIEVVFAGGTQVTGIITAKPTGGQQFVMLNNSLTVNVSNETRIISRGQLMSFADLRMGQTITVVGMPIVVAGITVGIDARVITF